MLSALSIAICSRGELVENFLKLNEPLASICLESVYSLYPSSSLLAPHTRSSTYSDCDMQRTKVGWTETNFSRCCRRVAFNRNGLDDTPNTTLVNRKTTTLGSFSTKLSTHRNLKESRSSRLIETMRKAFSMSAVNAIRYERNLIRISNIFWLNLGPV